MRGSAAEGLVLLIALVTSVGVSASWHWIDGPALPELRAHPACVTVNESVYFFGGLGHLWVPHGKFRVQHNPWMKDVMIFNSTGRAYSFVRNMSAPRLGMTATYHDGTIYLVGGKGVLMSTVTTYDVSLDAFASYGGMPKGRMHHAAILKQKTSEIYVCGGRDMRNNILRTCDILDLKTGRWSFLPTAIPNARMKFVGVVIGEEICLIGGTGRHGLLNVMDCVSTTTRQWQEPSQMPTALQFSGAVVLDSNLIFVIGGTPDADSLHASSTVYVFNATSKLWSRAPDMRTSRFAMCTALVNRLVYVFGGVSTEPIIETTAMTEIFIFQEKNISTIATPAFNFTHILPTTNTISAPMDMYSSDTPTPCVVDWQPQIITPSPVEEFHATVLPTANDMVAREDSKMRATPLATPKPHFLSLTQEATPTQTFTLTETIPLLTHTSTIGYAKFISVAPIMLGGLTVGMLFLAFVKLCPQALQSYNVLHSNEVDHELDIIDSDTPNRNIVLHNEG